MKLISIVTACFNEEGNVELLSKKIEDLFQNPLKNYDYEHIFIDNASSDSTVEILKEIASKDNSVKIIINTRNFGHIRSPYHAMMQAKGDAVILIVSDLQAMIYEPVFTSSSFQNSILSDLGPYPDVFKSFRR